MISWLREKQDHSTRFILIHLGTEIFMKVDSGELKVRSYWKTERTFHYPAEPKRNSY